MHLKFTWLFAILFCCLNTQAQLIEKTASMSKKPHSVAKKMQPVQLTNLPLNTRPPRKRCGFTEYMQKAASRGYNEASFEAAMKDAVQRRLIRNQTSFNGIVTIPVVFHVLYRTGQAISATTPNLPAAQLQAQINQLNADYGNQSGSTYGVAGDVRIRFCLALVDTTGKPMAEPGIDRINGSTRGFANTNTLDEASLTDSFDLRIKPATIWDPYSYFNVWTAAMDQSQLLGYATFPSLSTLAGLDENETNGTAGVVIAWQSVGSIASPGQDASYGFGRTLTHESGHFFGLRHIWGDDNCGNDYCADTPPQDDATSGCPSTGTLNNCVPSGPKMFENYMDYTDDACVNTFTAQQALRCQAAMDNSPRRLSLIGSKACQARAANAVQFAYAGSYNVLETAPATATCPASRSYSFNLYVSNAANGAASINFTSVGGTASLGRDYSISPASVSYTANDNAPKTVTITILDDQEVEQTETIEIGYTITGSGVVAGPDKQTLKLSIFDDDISGIAVNGLAPVKTILNENFNAAPALPTGWTTSVFDDGSGTYAPNQWVVSANGGSGTTGNAAHITRNITTKPNTYVNTNISDAYLFTPVLDGTGLKDLKLTFKWRCNGEEGYDEGYVGYIPEGTPVSAENVIYFDNVFVAKTTIQTANISLPASLANKRFTIVFNWENDETAGSNPPFTIDDVVVTGNNFGVATAAGSDTTFSHYSGQSISYYTNGGSPVISNIIATVSNPSTDLGCITANVQTAGTGKVALNTTAGSYFRTQKVIRITPTTTNNAVTHQTTLYFTTAELSPAWTATEIASLKILKVKEGVDIFGTITSADAQLVTPTFTDRSSVGYYSYTGNFTGFSQFMLVSANTALPVRMLNFDVVAKKSSIQLTWSTAQENNNRGFSIERSTNGTSFESIGWVNGRGNSSSQANYSFSDNFVQPNTVYYYRIRQKDVDNREDISSIRQARISKAGIAVTVSPVPAHNVLNVYIAGTNDVANLRLHNAQGQLVKTMDRVTTNGGNLAMDVTALPAGIYMLHVQMAEQNVVKKIVIEK